MASTHPEITLRYEPHERCPPLLALLVGFQGVVIGMPFVVLLLAALAHAADLDEKQFTWMIFGGMLLSAAVTTLQASRIGRVGAGHPYVPLYSINYIPASVVALAAGGPTLLLSLTVFSGLCYLAVPLWLPLVRRVITPLVSGVVMMIISISALPIALNLITDVPAGTLPGAGLYVSAVILVMFVVLSLRAPAPLRSWSLFIGIVGGWVLAALFGLWDTGPVASAAWVGVPEPWFPGLDLALPAEFWALAPMFAVVPVVHAVKSISDATVVQHACRRRPRATDYRMLQGTLYANVFGILAAAFLGILPTSFFSSLTASLTTITGVASRYVGYAMAVILLAAAFSPTLIGLFMSIPTPVLGIVLLICLGMFLVQGIQSVIQEGIDAPKSATIGLSLAIGAGMEFRNVFEGLLAPPWHLLLGSGVVMGGLTAILLTLFMDLSRPRPGRLATRLDFAELARIDAFLKATADRRGWDEPASNRLRSAGEEAISCLLQPVPDAAETTPRRDPPRLVVSAQPDGKAVDLQFVSLVGEENLGDRLAYLEDEPEVLDERDVSLRLLRHYASSVRHQKYHGMDIIMVRVES
ncbi:MAG: hypothetical protein F4W95_07220 [Chloroflexi bacterium]|nr:hypothetical protein [Chloroflexota bacterium]MYD48261.1 hypothetical protein [Chloroflexota bacterium]